MLTYLPKSIPGFILVIVSPELVSVDELSVVLVVVLVPDTAFCIFCHNKLAPSELGCISSDTSSSLA